MSINLFIFNTYRHVNDSAENENLTRSVVSWFRSMWAIKKPQKSCITFMFMYHTIENVFSHSLFSTLKSVVNWKKMEFMNDVWLDQNQSYQTWWLRRTIWSGKNNMNERRTTTMKQKKKQQNNNNIDHNRILCL